MNKFKNRSEKRVFRAERRVWGKKKGGGVRQDPMNSLPRVPAELG